MISQNQRELLITQTAKNAVFDGWGDRSFREAAVSVSLDPAFALEAYPTPPSRVIAHSQLADALLTRWVEEGGLSTSQGVRGCLHALTMRRFLAHNDVKIAVQKGIGHITTPWRAVESSKSAWATVDTMWRLATQHLEGDPDKQGFDYVSKRALLGAVYGPSMLVWFNDHSPDLSRTDNYVRGRLDNVVGIFGKFGRGRQAVSDFLSKLKPS